MKKFVWVIILFLISGCSSKSIEVENPISINYNDNNIVEKDYSKITNIISTMKFSCGKTQNYTGDILNITTNNMIYKFHISSNYYMEFQQNDKYCYTNDTKKVKKLIQTLDEITNSYFDISYFTIRNEVNYEVNEEESFIKLDKNENYIIINSLYALYDFKINQIEYNSSDNTYTEIDLLYAINVIEENKNIIIRKEILTTPSFKISFKNQYGYLVTILPFYNEDNNINFATEIKK